MSDGLGVVLAIMLMIVIALQVWHMWPQDEDESLDASNPVGFSSYDPEEHWDDDEPYEV